MTFLLRPLSPLRASSTKDDWLTNAYTSWSLFKYEPVLIAASLGHNRAGMKFCSTKTTLARLPCRLGLEGLWTPLVIFRTLSPICILSVLGRIRSSVWFGSSCCIFVFLTRWSRCCIKVLWICCKLLWCNYLFQVPSTRTGLVGRPSSFLLDFGGRSLRAN